MKSIKRKEQKEYDRYIREAQKTRRILHMFPEAGWLEVRTTVFLIRVLEQLGYAVVYGRQLHGMRSGLPGPETYALVRERNRDVYEERFEEIYQGYTGVIATLDTGRPGACIGLRFDMDGLSVTESREQDHLPVREGFSSVYPGTMHACGHDGHMAVGLALAHWAADHRDGLLGQLVFVFQPAEEGVRGAQSLLTSGCFPKLDRLFAIHIGLGMEEGVAGVGTGGFLGSEHMDIIFRGRAAHAGNAPQEGRNALLSAAQAALALHSLTQYGGGTARVNVGMMRAGTGRNVVCGEAVLGVNIRADKEEILRDLHRRVEEVVSGAATMFGTQGRIDLAGQAPCYERADEAFAKEAAQILRENGIAVRMYPAFQASEDVTRMMHAVEESGGKALHLMIGAKLAAGHHTERFDFGEEALSLAFCTLRSLVQRYADREAAPNEERK